MVDVAEHGGRDEVAVGEVAAEALPAGEQLARTPRRPARAITPRMRSHAAALTTGPISDRRVERIADVHRLDLARRRRADDLVVHVVVHVEARRQRTALAAEQHGTEHGGHRRGDVEVGVGEHDVGATCRRARGRAA